MNKWSSKAFFKGQNMWNLQVSKSELYGESMSNYHHMTLGWSWILWVKSLPSSSCCMIMQVIWPVELGINWKSWYIRWHAISRLLGVKESLQIHVGYQQAGNYATVVRQQPKELCAGFICPLVKPWIHLSKMPVVISITFAILLQLTILKLACFFTKRIYLLFTNVYAIFAQPVRPKWYTHHFMFQIILHK